MYWLCFSSDIGVVQIKDIDIRFYITRKQRRPISEPCRFLLHAYTDWAYLDLILEVTHHYFNKIASITQIKSTDTSQWWFDSAKVAPKLLREIGLALYSFTGWSAANLHCHILTRMVERLRQDLEPTLTTRGTRTAACLLGWTERDTRLLRWRLRRMFRHVDDFSLQHDLGFHSHSSS